MPNEQESRSWVPTMNLRWYRPGERCSRMLQQEWVLHDPESKDDCATMWRNVPDIVAGVSNKLSKLGVE